LGKIIIIIIVKKNITSIKRYTYDDKGLWDWEIKALCRNEYHPLYLSFTQKKHGDILHDGQMTTL